MLPSQPKIHNIRHFSGSKASASSVEHSSDLRKKRCFVAQLSLYPSCLENTYSIFGYDLDNFINCILELCFLNACESFIKNHTILNRIYRYGNSE